MRRASIALVVLALLAVPVVGLATASIGDRPPQQVATNATGEYTLAELKEDGTHYDKPSARIASDHVYWLTHEPGDEPWKTEPELLDEPLVKSNTLYLNSIRVSPEPVEFDVHMVFWEPHTRTVTEGNTTTTEQVARNVVDVEQRVTLGRGWPTATLDLPHHDDPVRLTIWIEGLGEEARWTLRHHSIATSDAIAINSEGDYLWRAFQEFIGPVIVGAFGVGYLVKRALDRAGVGPMWGYGPWIFLISLVTAFVVAGVFGSFAEIFVHAPQIVAGYVVAIFGVIVLETYTADVTDALFIQPEPESARSASGEHALDARRARKREETLLRTPGGDVAIVRSGLFPFLARVFGGTATLQGLENLDTEIEWTNDDGNLFVVAPGSDDVLEYVPESFEWDTEPSYVLGAAVVAGLGSGWYLSATLGFAVGVLVFVAGAAVFLRATDGHAAIEPAPAHLRSAWVTSMFLTKEADEAATLQESRKKRIREAAKNEKHVERELEERDATLVEEMHTPGGIGTEADLGDVDGALEFVPDDQAKNGEPGDGGDDGGE